MIRLDGPESTEALGRRLASRLRAGDVVALSGELGAGKTTLARGILEGRFATGAEMLTGRVLEDVEPYGKHLFYGFEGDVLLHVHLGLYGSFTRGTGPAPEPRGALRLRMVVDDGEDVAEVEEVDRHEVGRLAALVAAAFEVRLEHSSGIDRDGVADEGSGTRPASG